jgi:hypothetical protein
MASLRAERGNLIYKQQKTSHSIRMRGFLFSEFTSNYLVAEESVVAGIESVGISVTAALAALNNESIFAFASASILACSSADGPHDMMLNAPATNNKENNFFIWFVFVLLLILVSGRKGSQKSVSAKCYIQLRHNYLNNGMLRTSKSRHFSARFLHKNSIKSYIFTIK